MDIVQSYIYNDMSPFTGPPIVQPIPSVYYVIAGQAFKLECKATNDPQSPNMLTFRWFKESTAIKHNTHSEWTIVTIDDGLNYTYSISTNILNVDQHNGTYTCGVDFLTNRAGIFVVDKAINQSTAVIVESKQIICNLYMVNISNPH